MGTLRLYILTITLTISMLIVLFWGLIYVAVPTLEEILLDNPMLFVSAAGVMTAVWFIIHFISYPLWRKTNKNDLAALLATELLDQNFYGETKCFSEDFAAIERLERSMEGINLAALDEKYKENAILLEEKLLETGDRYQKRMHNFLYNEVLNKFKAHSRLFTAELKPEEKTATLIMFAHPIKGDISSRDFYIKWKKLMAEIYRLEKELNGMFH